MTCQTDAPAPRRRGLDSPPARGMTSCGGVCGLRFLHLRSGERQEGRKAGRVKDPSSSFFAFCLFAFGLCLSPERKRKRSEGIMPGRLPLAPSFPVKTGNPCLVFLRAAWRGKDKKANKDWIPRSSRGMTRPLRGRADIIRWGRGTVVRRIWARLICCVQGKRPGFPACAGNEELRGRVRVAVPSLAFRGKAEGRKAESRKAEGERQKE